MLDRPIASAARFDRWSPSLLDPPAGEIQTNLRDILYEFAGEVVRPASRALGLKDGLCVRSSVLASGRDGPDGQDESVAEHAARNAYEAAAIEPKDVNVVEVHDATAPAEILCYELIGFAKKGEGARLVEDGVTRLGGRMPVNTSGGLLRKGHPAGATGRAKIYEICEQLRGRAGARQVLGARPRLGVAENGGGIIGAGAAATVVPILEKFG